MPGLSIHVVDVAHGVVAEGMHVAVFALTDPGGPRRLLAVGTVNAAGVLPGAALAATLPAGLYEAEFHVGTYYRDAGTALPAVPFLDVVTYRFGLDAPHQHYHLPFKCTPWGYSCFRGGA